MVLLTESTFLRNVLLKNVSFEEGIKVYSTKGHLFEYFPQKGKISYSLKREAKGIYSFLSSLKEEVVIATDTDPAGELIAFECASVVPKEIPVFRFLKPVEELLLLKKVTKEYLLSHSVTKINLLRGIRYLEERFLSSFHEERMKALKLLTEKDVYKVPLKA